MGAVEHLSTSGTFSLDGGTWEVDNNVWIVGDSDEVLVIDAAHDAEAIAAVVGDRRLVAVVSTHAHDDHVSAAPELARRYDAPVLLHPAEHVLWRLAHPDLEPPANQLSDRDVLRVAGIELQVLHPGALAGLVLPARPGAGRAVQRGHAVRRWPRGDRTVLLGLPDDHLLDPLPAVRAAGRDRGPHRPRRPDQDRRRVPHLDEWIARGS